VKYLLKIDIEKTWNYPNEYQRQVDIEDLKAWVRENRSSEIWDVNGINE